MVRAHTPKGVVYCRGESPDRITEKIRHELAYVRNTIEIKWIDKKHLRALWVHVNNHRSDRKTIIDRRRGHDEGLAFYYDWSRSEQQHGRHAALEYIKEFDGNDLILVIPTVKDFVRNRKHVREVCEVVVSTDVTVHFVEDGIAIQSVSEVTEDMLMVAAGLHTQTYNETSKSENSEITVETEEGQEPGPDSLLTTVRRPYEGGRPPLGFEVEDGELVSNERYEEIRISLQHFRDGELSKKKAAERIGCARSTVTNMASKPDLYQLA